MARVDSSLLVILPRIVARIQSQVPELSNSGTCFLSLDPDVDPAPTPGGIWATVGPADGMVDDSLVDGGGRNQVTFDGQFLVTVHSPVQLDEAGHDSEWLTNATLGVCKLMNDVLESLACYDLTDSNSGGSYVLRQSIFPAGYRVKPRGRSGQMGSIGIVFGMVWDQAFTTY